MFFTREDIEKIHQGLLRLGIKDSELPETINVNSDDTLAVVQDGKNKKINIEEFFNNISLFKKEGFINITDRFNKHSISLIEAIQTVPTHQRIDGLVITFEDINRDWRIYQFRGNAVDFFDENKWTDLYDYTNYIVKSITPDEEDLTVSKPDKNGNAIVSLKDKVYDESNFSGKGYKILRKNIQTIDGVRKNILTQDMINKPNTIYEIRYDFDLNGAEITIPENCVLKFNGGSLSNGTINGNLYNIDAQKYKIFENINIKGAAKLNNYYLIDWWVKTPQYEFIKENNPIDNYEDIQSAFNSGAENFIFSSDRYYYIKKTLLINGEINLFSDVEHKHYDGNDRAHRKEPPCIYSNEIITLIEYKYKSDTYKGTIYIGTINLVCNKPFSNLSEKDVPILYLHADQSTVNTGVWGVVIKCNIKAKDLVIDLKNEYPDIYEQSVNIYAPNYTGLMIKADYVNFSYIKIYSYICMTYYGIIIPKTENNHWITDLTIEGDTRCVIGGKFIGGGNPVRIFGSHQPEYALAKTDEVRNVGYFVGNNIQLYGYVWDINKNTLPEKGNCTAYPVEILNTDGDYNNPILNNTILSPAIRFIKYADLNFRNFSIKALFLDNLLNYVGSPLFTNVIKNFSLKLNNIDYTEYPQIYNTRYLFGVYPGMIDRGGLYKSLGNIAYIIAQSDEEIPYKLHFELNSIGYTNKRELIIKCDTSPVHINIQTDNGKVLVNDTYNLANSFYPDSYFSIVLTGDINFIIDIETKIKLKKDRYIFLPLIKIPNENSVFNNKTNISDIKGDFIYDTAANKAGWWNGKYWADINGYNIDYNVKGTTANRPTLKSTDDGFEYYDTTLKKKIIWNGTEWTNMDGTTL